MPLNDWHEAVRWAMPRVATSGCARLRGALDRYGCDAVLDELAAQPFVPAPGRAGAVGPPAEHWLWRPGDRGADLIGHLASLLAGVVVELDLAPHNFAITEAEARREPVGHFVPQPRRESARYRVVVCHLVLAGEADFEIVADRTGAPTAAGWFLDPGDALLLAAPGLVEERPFFCVGPPLGRPRTSLTFRSERPLPHER